MCVVLWLCLIVAPLPPGINPFAVKNNNNNNKWISYIKKFDVRDFSPLAVRVQNVTFNPSFNAPLLFHLFIVH
jgi:hypothetical protein